MYLSNIILKQTVTVTVSTTSITTIDVTSTSTSVTIASPTLLSPAACTSPSVEVLFANEVPYVYNAIYSGTGVSENPINPSNDGPTPLVTTFPSSMTACDAVNACAAFSLPYGFFNIDLHFLIAEQEWSCTGYFDGYSSASDYNVADSNIGSSNGYQYNFYSF